MSRAIAAVGVVGVSIALLLTAVGLQGQEQAGQDKKAPPPKGKMTLPKYWSKLNLSASQKDQYFKVKSEYEGKIAPLEAQLKKLREEEKAAVAKVLTPEQLEQYRKLLADKAGVGAATTDKKTEPAKQ